MRAETDILARAGVPLVIGGETRLVTPLTIAQNREWKRLLADKIAGLDIGSSWASFLLRLSTLTDDQVELLVAYDRHNALGGREWIEAHATDTEVWDALKEVLELAYPQLRELKKLPIGEMIPSIVRLVTGQSMSSASPSGDSTQPASTGA